MAAARFLVLAMLLLLALSQLSNAYTLQGPVGRGRHLLTKMDCGKACATRCEVASVQDRCLKYCGICCRGCNCVPSGHYGNKDECSCYRDKKSSKGTSKCP